MLSNEELLQYVPEDGLLKDKVILITGASDGIGRAISLAYARYGATIVLLSKAIKPLEVIYDEIIAAGGPEPAIYPLNMEGANVNDYMTMAETIEKELGRLDGIVLNAGWLPAFIPFKEYEAELWSKTLTVNLHANFLITKSCLPLLEKAEDPAIVMSAHAGRKAYNGAFGIAKAGMDAMMDILADEYDRDEMFIRINSIDTGPLNTQMRRLNFPLEDSTTLASPAAIVGPYLYFMGKDAGKRTAEHIKYERLAADTQWQGQE
ncbi:MAG TPA: SDR family NAD(P)-dependent oxidoreductase [Leucothrix mucor]|nr:SDR family NAD(P)-dependent oxidoreductase [Leucothrix mucor]